MSKVLIYKDFNRLLEGKDMSFHKLFEKCGLTGEQAYNLMNDQPVGLDILMRLAEILDVPITDIFEIRDIPIESKNVHLYFMRKRWCKFASVPISLVTFDFEPLDGEISPLVVHVYNDTPIKELMDRVTNILYLTPKYEKTAHWDIEEPVIIPYEQKAIRSGPEQLDNAKNAIEAVRCQSVAINYRGDRAENVHFALCFKITEPKSEEES